MQCGAKNVTHLLFANNTLIFYNTSPKQLMENLSRTFMSFKTISCLKITLNKNELIWLGCWKWEALAATLDYRIEHSFFTYLGLLIGVPFKLVRILDIVEKRYSRRLLMWKKRYLSKIGKSTLIISTLSSLSIYFMFLFVIPKK